MTLATSLRRGHDTARFAPIPRLGMVSRVRSSIRSAHLLSRATSPAGQTPPPVGFVAGIVQSPRDVLFEPLAALAEENRLARAWCLEQLAKGSSACVAMLSRTTRAVGMGWVTQRAVHVSEIDCTFDPCARGCYLYCGYVSPSFRGRRIHRLLDAARLAHAAQRWGATVGYTLVVPTNISSLRGHAAAGFSLSARISVLDTGPVVLALLRRTRIRSPIGSFRCAGGLLRTGLNIFVASSTSSDQGPRSQQTHDGRPPIGYARQR